MNNNQLSITLAVPGRMGIMGSGNVERVFALIID